MPLAGTIVAAAPLLLVFTRPRPLRALTGGTDLASARGVTEHHSERVSRGEATS